jgi:hypothetical protein
LAEEVVMIEEAKRRGNNGGNREDIWIWRRSEEVEYMQGGEVESRRL